MVARNGIADDTLTDVPGEPGARLRADAAASWGRLCDDVERRYGWRPRLTSAGDAFRPYAVQERIFRQRYTTTGPTAVDWRGKRWDGSGNGVPETWWRLPIWAAAATPGASNHGWGVACDVTGLGGFHGRRYREFKTVALEHGWDNVEGAAIAEAWHWRYRPHNDRHAGATAVGRPVLGVGLDGIPTLPGGALPAALTRFDRITTPEEDVIPFVQACYAYYLGRPGSPLEWAGHIDDAVDDDLSFAELAERIGGSREALEFATRRAYADQLGRVPTAAEVKEWADKGLTFEAYDDEIGNGQEARLFRTLPAAERARRIADARRGAGVAA